MSNNKLDPQVQTLIEAKLSRSEVVELVISDMISELKRGIGNIDRQLEKLETVPAAEIIPFLGGTTFSFRIDHYGDDAAKKVFISFNRNEIAVSSLTGALKDRATKIRELIAERKRLNNSLSQLDGNKSDARVLMLKKLLDQTSEGQALLNQLNAIRKRAAISMGAAVDVKLLSGK